MPLKLEALNQKLAIIAWGKDENGQDDVAVFTGILASKDNVYFLNRGADHSPFEIRDRWLSRICKVQQENKEILLGADYQLSLSVGNLADDDLVSFAQA